MVVEGWGRRCEGESVGELSERGMEESRPSGSRGKEGLEKRWGGRGE